MAKRPTKKQLQEMAEEKKRLELKAKRKESKTYLLNNISRLHRTLRNRHLLMRKVSDYLQAGQTNYKQIQDLGDEVQALNDKLENLMELNLNNRELVQND